MPRLIGFILLLGGFILLVASLFGLVTGGGWEPMKLGTAWFNIHSGSLQVVQPAVERYLSPVLWQSVIAPVLNCWLWLVMMVLGLLMMLPAMLRQR